MLVKPKIFPSKIICFKHKFKYIRKKTKNVTDNVISVAQCRKLVSLYLEHHPANNDPKTKY